MTMKIQAANNKARGNQGTVIGVFIPCLQNILGIILFLRLPSITGEAGLFQTYIIILLGTTATLLTTLSMNAIATNGKMSKGGAYYLLSRSLGPATGGSLGFLFYIATTISGAMYIIGSVETFMVASGFGIASHGISIRVFSLILLVILLAITFVGINYVSKAGIVFFVVTCISLLSIFVGLLFAGLRKDDLPHGTTGLGFSNFKDNFWSGYRDDSSFFVLLSIFFPACTGIMAGSNRSGDLREPHKSIPKGTLTAQLSTTIGYYIFVFLFASVARKHVLLDEAIIFVAEVAWPFKFLVHAGIIFSSLGAALQSLAGSPRILTAIAGDDILPFLKIFKRNVYYPLCLNGVLCVLAIMIGSLDAVAPIVSIFFLSLYGGINAACFLLDYLGSPNWRPTWKYFHKLTALGGLVLCVAIMIMTSWYFALIATILALCLYAYIEKRTKERDWGDGIVGMRAERARDALLKLDKYKTHVKNWRPKYLALGSVNEKGEISSTGVLNLLNQLRKGTGLAIYGCVVRGEYSENSFKEAKKKEKQLDEYLSKNKLHVFSKVILTNDVENGLIYLIQASGLGGLEPNTVLLSWPEEWEHDLLKIRRFVHIIDSAHTYGHVITVLKPEDAFDSSQKHKGTIDIWSFYYAKGMLLLIAHLLSKAKNWRACNVRLFVVTTLEKSEHENLKKVVRDMLEKYRLLINVYIETVQVTAEEIEPFSYNMDKELKDEDKVIQQVALDKKFEDQKVQNLMKLNNYQRIEDDHVKKMIEKRQTALGKDLHNNQTYAFEKQAISINRKILEMSEESSLVITNLPYKSTAQSSKDFLLFCSQFTEGLKRVLLIRNTGKEVITQYT